MIVTVAQLLALVDTGALQAVARGSITAAARWRLKRLNERLGPEMQRATAARFELLTDDNSVSVGPTKRRVRAGCEADYLAALRPLMDERVEIAAEPIARASIADVLFNEAELAALDPLLDPEG